MRLHVHTFALKFVVRLGKRFNLAPRGTNTFISLDGTDFRIPEPTVFDPKWFSHKFNGPGLRYEIALHSHR